MSIGPSAIPASHAEARPVSYCFLSSAWQTGKSSVRGKGIGGGKEPPGSGEGGRTLEDKDSVLNLSPRPLGEQTKLHGKQQQQLVSYRAFWAGIGAVGLSGQLARLVQEPGSLQSSRLLCCTLHRVLPREEAQGWMGQAVRGGTRTSRWVLQMLSSEIIRNPLRTWPSVQLQNGCLGARKLPPSPDYPSSWGCSLCPPR